MKKTFNPKFKQLTYILFLLLSILFNTFNPELSFAQSDQNKKRIVAIIDTGIDYLHDDLKDYMWTNRDEIAGDGIDNDGNGYIDDVNGWNYYANNNMIYNSTNNYDDHGTHSAGILVGYLSNANVKNVEVMSIKVLGGKNRTGTTKHLIKAIKYAEHMGASICNISLGTTYHDKALRKVIKDSNMIFITAAGNGKIGKSNDEAPIYPASYTMNNIISVANITSEDELHKTSNYGATSVDIAAEGTDIYSMLTHNGYGKMTGTSMATLQVTGTVAVISSLYPHLSAEQVKSIIIDTAEELEGLENKVVADGKLDYENAIKYVKKNIMNES